MALKTLGGDGAGEEEGGGSILAEINITPLVDIFLVLLIIFMVTSSVMSQLGVNVNLPKASQGMAQGQPDGVIVTLLSQGVVKVNGGAEIPAGPDLVAQVKAAFAKTSSKLIILEGDRQAFLGSAIQVMDLAREAGAENFAIATSPEKSK